MPTKTDLIYSRLSKQKDLDSYRKKVHKLRMLLAGDISGLNYGRPQKAEGDEVLKPSLDRKGFFDVNVTDIEEGRSNRLLQAVKAILFQVSHNYPDISLEDCDQTIATLTKAYLQVRLGPSPRGCNATDHMKRSLGEALVGSMGWSNVGFNALGYPVVTSVDALDVSWDQQCRVAQEARWASVRVRRPYHEWKEIYKGSRVFDEIVGKLGDEGYDKVIEVEEYCDVEGELGTRACFVSVDGAVHEKPIEVTENPFFYEVDGYKQPFLPLDPITFLHIPSVRYALSETEMMLPSQIAIWGAERAIRDTVAAGVPFWDVVEGAYDTDQMERFEDGDVGSVIKRKDASMPPAQRQAGLEIPATLREHLQYHDSNIVAESGVNPYALGDTAAGTQYAAEVNAIQGAAGLTAGVIQKAHTAHWERTITKFPAVCKQYDDMPIHLRYDDVKLMFDASDPIRGYLEPDARVTVREDSLSFAPKAQGIAMAKDELAVAQGMAQQFPMAVQQAYEQYLTATGKKNTQKWLEQPEMNSLPGPDHGAAAAQASGIA